MKQGITIVGTLANIKQNKSKEYKGEMSVPTQDLQITVLNDDGMSIVDVRDKEFKYKESDLKKDLNIVVAYSVMNNKAYFRLA